VVHPALLEFVREAQEHPAPRPWTLSPDERRRRYREESASMWGTPETLHEVRDLEIALEGRTLPVRLYTPNDDERRALVIFIHGGSFVMGDLESHDALCRRLAADTRMRYLAVDYRLAPEHPFPASVDDACDVVRYVATHMKDFAEPDTALIVMGESAGATLATVAATQLRADEVAVAAQVLIYPTLGPHVLTDSAHVYNTGFLLDLDNLRYDYEQYLGDYGDTTDPRVSPLLVKDLVGSPPAIVVVAECDPLRDEAVAYAGLLEHFGVPVELLEAEGMLHGFLRLGGFVPETLGIVDEVAARMRRFVTSAVV